MVKNMYEMLRNACSENKDRIFFVRENETFADLLTNVKKRAVLLSEKWGIKKGDTVAILSINTPEFIKSYFAITSLGAKALMLDTGLSSTEHVNMMKHTKCKLALAQKNFFCEGAAEMFDIETPDTTDEKNFKAADVDKCDIAQLSFTSGTTNKPKIVGLTHGNLIALGDGIQPYGAVLKPDYIMYGFLPLYHIYGVVVNIIAPLRLRMPLLLQTVLNPREFLEDFKKYKPHAIPGVPRVWEGFYKKIIEGVKEKKKYTAFRVILAMRGVLRAVGLGFIVNKVTQPIQDIFGGRLAILCSAGATLKPNIRKFYEALGFTVGDCYGLTETTGPANFNLDFIKFDGKRSYAGPLPGNEIKIHNPDRNGVGEIWFRGDLLMQGYVDNPEANAEAFEDGWFKTGDIGSIDSKKRLTVKGRAKQIIVLESGKNVYPDELEDLYLMNDEILAAAVVERTVRGKIAPFAVFQVSPGTTVEQVAMLLKLSNLRIAPYKWVNNFAITEDELPQTSAKKIKHFEIKAMLDRGEFPDRNE